MQATGDLLTGACLVRAVLGKDGTMGTMGTMGTSSVARWLRASCIAVCVGLQGRAFLC